MEKYFIFGVMTNSEIASGVIQNLHETKPEGAEIYVAAQDERDLFRIQRQSQVKVLDPARARSLVDETIAESDRPHRILRDFPHRSGEQVLVFVESNQELTERMRHIMESAALDGGEGHVPPK